MGDTPCPKIFPKGNKKTISDIPKLIGCEKNLSIKRVLYRKVYDFINNYIFLPV
jgi:hypothetical protein